MAARRRAECEEKCGRLIATSVAEQNYAAAAELQAKVDKEIRYVVGTGHESAESVGAREAAAADARARRRAEDEERYVKKIKALLAARNYAGAARLQAEMKTRTIGEEARARHPSAAGHDGGPGDACGRESSVVDARARRRAEEEERYQNTIKRTLVQLDYDGAACLRKDREARLKAEEAEGGPTWVTGQDADAGSRCRAELTERMVALGNQGDFAGASALKNSLMARP